MLVAGEIVRLGLHLRDQVLAHDRDRHGPVRIEVDLDDAGIELGRRPVRLADHRDVARHHDAVLDRLELRGRDVAHDEAVRLLGVERAQAREVDLELAEPLLGRNVQRLEGERARPPVGRNPVARLEAPHRGLDIGVVDVVLDRARVEIAGELEPRAQRHDRRIARAEPQPLDRRHRRPAAARHDLLVARDRELGVLHGRRARASAARPSASGWCARRSRTPARCRCAGSAGSVAAADRRPARTRSRATAPRRTSPFRKDRRSVIAPSLPSLISRPALPPVPTGTACAVNLARSPMHRIYGFWAE